jgi:circadian clock protein KaiC
MVMQKTLSGVPGLDEILRGGFPTARTTIVLGGAGTGKTVLAMQFLVNGATDFGEPGLMVSFEESPAALEANFGRMHGRNGEPFKDVHIVDGRLAEDTIEAGTFDLGGLIAIAASLVKQHGIRRVAIDGIDALFARTEDMPHRRIELIRVLNWLTTERITALLTVKDTAGANGLPNHFGLAEYAADGVIHLRSRTIGELARRTFSVIKMRGAGFDAGEHPYIISERGIRAQRTPNRTMISESSSAAQLSSGVERFDRMLVGGYRAGTTTLISGLPGTAKTTLSAAFLEAGCRAGERGLFVGFDEPWAQMFRDVRSVGIDLQPHLESGMLHAESFAAGAAIADEHILTIERLIEEYQPVRLVIDPISALDRAGGSEIASVVAERLVVMLKLGGVSSMFTVVAESLLGEMESAPTRISTIADNWIHLSFANRGGERNRTITIVKARGLGHSNQMRELLLTSDGIDLADVYSTGGAVLLGSARAQRELEDRRERAAEVELLTRKLKALDNNTTKLKHKVTEAERAIADIDAQRAELVRAAQSSDGLRDDGLAQIRLLRKGDPI